MHHTHTTVKVDYDAVFARDDTGDAGDDDSHNAGDDDGQNAGDGNGMVRPECG